MPEPVSQDAIALGLQRAEGTDFERFGGVLLAQTEGAQFIPVGGLHDGGSDGCYEPSGGNPTSRYYQLSVQKTAITTKICHTVARLRETERQPKALVYVTSVDIPNPDAAMLDLSTELGCSVILRSQKWVAAHVNDSPGTIAAFRELILPYLEDLVRPGAARLLNSAENIDAIEACVFLEQELRRIESNRTISNAIVDSLVLWSLRDTDPEQQKLMTRQQILADIERVFPQARDMIRSAISARLPHLTRKNSRGHRSVNHHTNPDAYCLPYETRERVREQNANDAIIVSAAAEDFLVSAHAHSGGETVLAQIAAEIALRSYESMFEKFGLRFAQFAHGQQSGTDISFGDLVLDRTAAHPLAPTVDRTSLHRLTMNVLRDALYRPTSNIRELTARWAKTYTILFSMKIEPRVARWLDRAARDFSLFVGADIIIKAFSERLLPENQRSMTRLLDVMRAEGARLILAEPVLDEVWTHVRAEDYEYENHYQHSERFFDADFAQAVPRILIRAYLLAKTRPLPGSVPPKSWEAFIDQFVPWNQVRHQPGRAHMKQYLIERFSMSFSSWPDISNLVDSREVVELAHRLEGKRDPRLATNDATLVYAVYGKRQELGETQQPNPFGYRTWWLTNEIKIVHATQEVIRNNDGRYIMRPGYLLTYFVLRPGRQQVTDVFAQLFPTTLGVQLGGWVSDDVMHQLLTDAERVAGYDEARKRVEMRKLSNILMGSLANVHRATET